ncbi:hypothetical protein GCM10027440_19880 [Nocardiopsis coralliicola]
MVGVRESGVGGTGAMGKERSLYLELMRVADSVPKADAIRGDRRTVVPVGRDVRPGFIRKLRTELFASRCPLDSFSLAAK